MERANSTFPKHLLSVSRILKKPFNMFVGMVKKNFAAGGASHDVLHIISKYGIVPEEVYTGLVTDDEMFVHSEMDLIFKNYVDAVIQNKTVSLLLSGKKDLKAYLIHIWAAIRKNLHIKAKSILHALLLML